MRSIRIVATYGPACADPARLGQLIAAGVDIFRINCSHGRPATHTRAVAAVRQAAAEAGRDVAVLADLPGPKIRVGILPEPWEMRAGEHVALRAAGRPAEPGVIPVEYPRLAAEVRPGDRVLLRDGLLELAVDRVSGDVVHATVRRGGTLSSRQGVNLPGVSLSTVAPTAADLRHLRDMLGVGVELVALSFVRSADDVERLRTAIRAQGARAAIVAKIERPEALDNLAAILDATDVVMVARGDLGVEIGPELVPLAQKQIIAAANARTVPVITATEMLESMVGCQRPTRAEVSDVANAVLDGTDAVMLSAETARGAYPVEAVGYVQRICRAAQSLTHAVAAQPALPRQPATPILSKAKLAAFPSVSTAAAGYGEQAATRLSG